MKKVMRIVAVGFAVSLCVAIAASSQSTIGPPSDGESYTVQSVKIVTRPDSKNCGFNDIGAANPAVFQVEHRKYSNYQDGKLVSTHYEDVETFDHCYEP